MYYTRSQIKKSYKFFKLRIKKDRGYCEELYNHATIRVMAFKYSYYVINKFLCCDDQYDLEQTGWYIMGRALGFLDKEETSPCVDFDEKHPMAQEGISLALRLQEKKRKKPKRSKIS